ncbi:MAG TPA: hypothetical protein VGZ23_17140 [bacterium]|nr:hypothetical protein [bacterium]
MRRVAVAAAILALSAALWTGGAGPASAIGDDHEGDHSGAACQPGPVFVPGYSLGPVNVGAPMAVVQRWFGQPRAVQRRTFQGNLWTRLVYAGLNVLARNDAVVALTLPQGAAVPVQTNCGTLVTASYNLPVGTVLQTYGAPSSRVAINGQQYWVYNTQGMLLALPAAGNIVQGVTIYPAGQYCAMVPMYVSLFGFAINVGSAMQCTAAGGLPEREGGQLR